MREWTVEVIAEGKADEAFLERVVTALDTHHGVAGAEEDTWSARFNVLASDAAAAAAVGLATLVDELQLAKRAAIVHVEASTLEHQLRELERPTLPDLVGSGEVAELLGVTVQRVNQLMHENPHFPPSVVDLRATPVWLRTSIEAFRQAWPRRSGRPRLAHAERIESRYAEPEKHPI